MEQNRKITMVKRLKGALKEGIINKASYNLTIKNKAIGNDHKSSPISRRASEMNNINDKVNGLRKQSGKKK